jgi:glycosyltransferase involved in cell wall biosynthesis
MKLSIIINNYNYDRFVRDAIESALAIDWPDKEIIVVDDGSTDDSRDVVESFGDCVIPVFKAEGGQSSACNVGFERSSGDVIIFLDSDDILFPSVAETLRSAWYEGASKLQWSLVIVDETLKPLGGCNPAYRRTPTPEWVKQTLMRTGHYPYSTNGAWPRAFLSQVFPLPVRKGPPRSGGSQGDYRVPNMDRYMSQLAPFFGDVVCISHHDPQGAYRIHKNNSLARGLSLDHFAEICAEELECARRINDMLASLGISNERIDAEYHEDFMKRQLVCTRLNLDGPNRRSSLFPALWKYWRAVALDEAPMATKLKWYIWSLIVAAGPRPVSLWAVQKRRWSVGPAR